MRCVACGENEEVGDGLCDPCLKDAGEPVEEPQRARKSRTNKGLVSSGSAEWGTPPELIEPARLVLGGFDLDPASSDHFNISVRASRYFTADDDGLTKPWGDVVAPSRVWLNPPSQRGKESAAEWWVYLAREFMAGRVRAAAFVVFNVSFLQVAQKAAATAGVPGPQCGSRVEPSERIKFLRKSRNLPLPVVPEAILERGNAPPHPSAVILLSDDLGMHARWRDAYAPLGACMSPVRLPERVSAASVAAL